MWDFGGGLTLSWIYSQKPEIDSNYGMAEIRPFIEVSHERQLGKVYFQNRIRIDNRFLEVNHENRIWKESYYLMRLRYRAQVRMILKRNENIPIIGLRIADEIMLNTKQNPFDQNRIYTSVDFLVLKRLSVEPSYVYIYQQRLGRDEFFSRHVLRLSFIHRI